MATLSSFGAASMQAGGPRELTTTEGLERVNHLLLAKKPWPAFLLVGADALDEWENCPDVAKEALEWMTTSAVGVLDIASVGPLTPICQAFKALIEAAGGAAEAEDNLRELISWCSFIIGVFIKLGKTRDALSDTPAKKCLQEFETTSARLAKRAQKLASRPKSLALIFHRKDCAEIASFEIKLRKIWADVGVLATLDVLEAHIGLLPPKLEPLAAVPIGALSLPDSHVERTSMVEEVVAGLEVSGAGSPPHMLLGMGGGGKTVLASSVVRHGAIRKHFRQGIFWIRVGQRGKDQLHALFQGLAREVGATPTDTPHGIPSDGFHSVDAVIQHLTAATAVTSLPRLVVLDDVWEREVVDTVLPTGLVFLVTTRDESVVTVPGGTRTHVGDMTEEEAMMLLGRASGNVGSPDADVQREILQVGRDCGYLPLALSIAGCMPVVKGRGSSVQAWKQLHKDFENRGDMLLAKSGTNRSLQRVLDASFDALGAKKQDMLLRMAVLPKGSVAPEDMLQNLWDVEDVEETRNEARGLVGRSLLQAVGNSEYRMHDLLLDFARDRIRPARLELAASCQARYLGRLDVVRRYADEGENKEGLHSLVAFWRSVRELSGTAPTQVEGYLANLREVAEDETSDAFWVHWALGSFFELQGKYREAEPLYLRCVNIKEKTLGSDHPYVAASLSCLAGVLEKQGKYTEAMSLYLRAIDMEEKILGPDHPSTAKTVGSLALLLHAKGKYEEAESLYLRSIDTKEKTLGKDHHDAATTLNNLAALYTEQGKYAEAESLCLRVIDKEETRLGPDHPSIASQLNNLASVLEAQGKLVEAESLYTRCIEIVEKTLGSDHPLMGTMLHNLAGLLKGQGKYAEAEPIYLRCIDIKETSLGGDHHEVAISLNSMAGLCKAQARYAEAERLYRRAIDIQEKVLGPDHPSTATSLSNLAILLELQGNRAQAESLYGRAIDIQEKTLGANHPFTAASLNNLAVLLEAQGKYAEAEPLYIRSISIKEELFGPDHHEVSTVLCNLAGLFTAQGKDAEAEPLFRRGIDITEKTLGPEHPSLTTPLNNLGMLMKAQRNDAAAELLFRRVIDIAEKALGSDHPSMASSLNNLAMLLKEQGKLEEAGSLIVRAINIEENTLGADHPEVAASICNLAVLVWSQGQHNEAIQLLDRAFTIYTHKLGAEHARTINTQELLQITREKVGQTE